VKLIIIVFLICLTFLTAQDAPIAYSIFDKEGKEVDYDDMIESLLEAEFVLLGENHNDAMIHWLHFRMIQDMYTTGDSSMTIGVEFFERDDQLAIDEYFADFYTEKKFLQEAQFWSNYETDYRPVLEFAKNNKINYIGTNIPRRYASIIHKKGLSFLDSLSDEAKKMIAPIPFPIDTTIKSYKDIYSMMKSHGGTWDMVYAQMSKDATMAWFSLEHYNPSKLFVHIQGAGHSDDYNGISWYLRNYRPESIIKTVSISPQKNMEELNESELNKADFIIVVPEDFIKTYRGSLAK
jgi:uncharacterized iron-regulated protein